MLEVTPELTSGDAESDEEGLELSEEEASVLASPVLDPPVTSAVEEPAVVDSWAEVDWFEETDSKVEVSD